MAIRLISLTIVTITVAVLTLAQPWRERDWSLGALAMGVLTASYAIAVLLVQGRELPSPIRLIERLTEAVLSLFR